MAATGKHMQKPAHRGPDKSRLLISLLALITLAAVGVTLWAVFFRDRGSQAALTPDYAPQELEENAEPMEDQGEEKLEAAEGGGAVSLTYSTDVTVTLSEETASLYFGNPSKSTQDIILQLTVQETVILQSGLIPAGSQVSSLRLLENAADLLAPGGYDGKFVVQYYDPNTGERAVITTEIPVTVTVID